MSDVENEVVESVPEENAPEEGTEEVVESTPEILLKKLLKK